LRGFDFSKGRLINNNPFKNKDLIERIYSSSVWDVLTHSSLLFSHYDWTFSVFGKKGQSVYNKFSPIHFLFFYSNKFTMSCTPYYIGAQVWIREVKNNSLSAFDILGFPEFLNSLKGNNNNKHDIFQNFKTSII